MRTLRLTIAYDGTRYAGWQRQRPRRQRNARPAPHPTIQETIERVLERVLQEPARLIASGRTDAGVHALAQVAHARVHSRISVRSLQRALNSLLPPDIVVRRVEEAPLDFHARFDALGKRYRYRIATGSVVLPFARPYVHHVQAPLDVALMRREARALRGRHDFRALSRMGGSARSGVRAITDVVLRRRQGELQLELEGSGFLHAMIRGIAGTLIDIGRGHLPPGTIRRLLQGKDCHRRGATAAARGLILLSVSYPLRRRSS